MKSIEEYGLMAEFSTPEALLGGVSKARMHGFSAIEAYTPFSVEGLPEAIGCTQNRVPMLALLGGIAGGAGMYFLQWYTAVIDYPVNSGGRPLHAWPAFIPATFEMTVLGAALAVFFGFLALNGLPKFYHPVFNASDFDLASRNRFFLCIRSCDPHFDSAKTHDFLQILEPIRVFAVPLGAEIPREQQ
jgi:hypothetical protein